MSTDNPKLTLGIVEALKNKGLSQSEIARQFSVSRQYVSWIKKQYGGSETPREQVGKHFPWKVEEKFTQAVPYHRMRDHGEYMATGGKGMKQWKLDRLRGFYNKLHAGLVIEFDPDIPPTPGVSAKGGYAFREATPEEIESGILIRENDYSTLTDESRMIWRFPPVEP